MDGNCMKKNVIIVLLLLITIFSSLITLYVLFIHDSDPLIIPDYLPEMHTQAVAIPENEDDKSSMDLSAGQQGAVVACGASATVHLDDKAIEYYYSNPSRSASAVVLQLLVDNQVIGQSGTIHPGYRTYSIVLAKDVLLAEGEYAGVLRIAFYDSETEKKAPVDSEVDIEVIVER